MEKEKCFYLGTVSKLVGFKGELMIFIDSDEPEKYAGLDAVFIEVNRGLIPFFIQEISARNKPNHFTVKFQDIDNEEDASRLLGCSMYLPLEALPPLEGNAFYFHEVVGFSVQDSQKGFIGHIANVLDYPGNPLFEIEWKEKTILIPVKDEFIHKLDREQKVIYITAPNGLIDLYLENQDPQ